MNKHLVRAVLTATMIVSSGDAFSQQRSQFGTSCEAEYMLRQAIAAVKADKAKALEKFKKGEGEFRNLDLYPFCVSLRDGKIVATQISSELGVDSRTLKDSTGKNFGKEAYDAMENAKDGEIVENSYLSPRPGSDSTEVEKVSLLMKAGDLYCGVGYYKPPPSSIYFQGFGK